MATFEAKAPSRSLVRGGDFTAAFNSKAMAADELEYGVKTFDKNLRPDFNNIYVNGKSVSDICAKEIRGMKDEAQKANHMKCFVTAKAMERKSRIDIVTPGESVPTVESLHAKVTNEPKKNIFRRFGEWAGFLTRKPTKQEQYEKDFVENDPERETRQTAIQRDINKKEAMRENLEYSKTIADGIMRDRKALGKAFFGDIGNQSGFTFTEDLKYGPHISHVRSGVDIGIAYLFSQGHTFEEIMNPDKLQDKKAAVGKDIMQWATDNLSGDPKLVEESRGKLADVYRGFAEKFQGLESLKINHASTKEISENYREIHGRGFVAHDISQEFKYVKDIVAKQVGDDKYSDLINLIGASGELYGTLETADRAHEIASGAEKERMINKGLVYLHARDGVHEVLSSVNKLSDLTHGKSEREINDEILDPFISNKRAEVVEFTADNFKRHKKNLRDAIMLGVNIFTQSPSRDGAGNEFNADFSKIQKAIDNYKKEPKSQGPNTNENIDFDKWHPDPSKQPKERVNFSGQNSMGKQEQQKSNDGPVFN
ncbi:MAG: hypothetical protein FWB91_03185 [Defluviitaleaceae bacterium]|nr:hypothetical protein [Defluviitaleaceae bacterium]